MLKIGLQLFFTAAAFWLAFHNVAWRDLQDVYSRQETLYVWAAVCAVFFQGICGALRWHHMRRALGGPGSDNATHTSAIYFTGNFFNVCFPSTLGGDLARIWLVKKNGGVVKDTIYGVILDRAMSLLGLLLLIASTLPPLFVLMEMDPSPAIIIAAICWLLAAMCYALLRVLLPKLRPLTRFTFLNDIIGALQRVVDKYVPLLCALCWSVAAHTTYAVVTYALARSLNIDIGLFDCLVLVMPVLFIAALPISFGGWGVREIGMTTMLAFAGVAYAPALMISLQVGVISTFCNLLGGLCYLTLRRK